MNTKHTPGPWIVTPAHIDMDGTIGYWTLTPVNSLQSFVNFQENQYIDINLDTAKANATLCAAAPEMLEMLVELNAAIDIYNNEINDINLKNINRLQTKSLDLITKATTI